MSPTIKDRIIIAVANLPKTNQARDLQPATETDVHNIVHVLYSLNRQGLVGFHLVKKTHQQIPANIFLTKQGKKYRDRITHG